MKYFELLSEAVTSYNDLSNFINGDGFIEALNIITEVHTEAAKRAIGELPKAKDKRGLVREIISHLRVAHVSNEKIYKPSSLFNKFLNKTPFTVRRQIRAAVMAWRISSLMAVCNCYLGEAFLVQEHIKKAKEEFDCMVHIVFNSDTGSAMVDTFIDLYEAYAERITPDGDEDSAFRSMCYELEKANAVSEATRIMGYLKT